MMSRMSPVMGKTQGKVESRQRISKEVIVLKGKGTVYWKAKKS